MKIGGLTGVIVGIMLSMGTARADEVTIVTDVLGPEGPLFLNGNLYYVAWTSGTLSKWDGKTSTVLNKRPGCSHNGLALTKQHTFLVACSSSTWRARSCGAGTLTTRAGRSKAASTISW